MTHAQELLTIFDRLVSLHRSEQRSGALNETQILALDYLSRANRFSRNPSHVAEYLAATRGTVSQTLKTLATKGLIRAERSAQDKRSVSYTVTGGTGAVRPDPPAFEAVLGSLDTARARELADALKSLLREVIAARGDKNFGICKTCKFHDTGKNRRFCRLLDVALSDDEAEMICHEHKAA